VHHLRSGTYSVELVLLVLLFLVLLGRH